MTPDRRTIVNGKKVEEYYWAGKMVVYIDNHAIDMTFEEAVAHLKQDAEKEPK